MSDRVIYTSGCYPLKSNRAFVPLCALKLTQGHEGTVEETLGYYLVTGNLRSFNTDDNFFGFFA